ncbi:MAG TPA: hypothetical protein VG826_11010 [Pirellulales bacterium]|nr:hypothetical protein [Pirellulales bacterium]
MTFAVTMLTFVHVVISLAGIATGFVVVYGLLTARRLDGWTATFLATTVLTSVTGFFFPFHGFTPGQALGVLALLALALALVARYRRQMIGAWRTVYVISAVVSLYFNVFVLVVQLFQKVPALAALAPTQSEMPFIVVQGLVLATFVVTTTACVIRFRGEAVDAGLD